MNKAILIGRLTKDVDLRYTQNNNIAVAQFSIAINKKTKQENQPTADFINIVAYGKTAEFISKYFKKGQQIGIVGRIQTRNYDDKDGKRVYVTEVIAEEVEFIGSKEQAVEDLGTKQFEQAVATDDELPF